MSRRGATWQGFWAVAWALGCRKRTQCGVWSVWRRGQNFLAWVTLRPSLRFSPVRKKTGPSARAFLLVVCRGDEVLL